MDELRPRSEMTGAAGWDGVECREQPDRRAQPTVRVGVPAWRKPDRMSGAILAGVGSGVLVETLRFLAEHIQVTWH